MDILLKIRINGRKIQEKFKLYISNIYNIYLYVKCILIKMPLKITTTT